MTTLISRIRIIALLCSISFSSLSALAGETKDTGSGGAIGKQDRDQRLRFQSSDYKGQIWREDHLD